MHDSVVLIFAKTPLAGQVKTRLIPAIGVRAATQLYIDLLEREVGWIAHELSCAIELWVMPDRHHPVLRQLAHRHALPIYLQRGNDLGQRMEYACRRAMKHYQKVMLLGVDCPALTARHLRQAFSWLSEGADAVLGPAQDGGYVVLALRRCDRQLFEGHHWGEDDVADSTRAALGRLGWVWRELPVLWDLDRPEDLPRLKSLGIELPHALPRELGLLVERDSPLRP